MKIILSLFLSFLSIAGSCEKPAGYSVPKSLWPESFGNHRAVIEISKPCEVATLDILWRRHDPDPQKRQLIIVEESTGDTIANILRYSVTNERCRLAFGPVKNAGTYYFYYLPFEVQENWGFYGKDYLKPEKSPSAKWVNINKAGDMSKLTSFTPAKLTGFQSRTAFDSFYPMEIIPLSSEKKNLLAKYKSDYLIFPEDRSFPVRMKDDIPFRWVERGPSDKFSGEALKKEYYAFQIGIYAAKKELMNLKVEFSSLENSNYTIPASSLTCFNTGGTGPYGTPFEKRVDLLRGAVQPLWIGIDIPESIPSGSYRGTITIRPENADPQTIEVNLKVGHEVLADRGDGEPWRRVR